MDKDILIISTFYEPNVNAVIERLEGAGVRWFRFNVESFPLLNSGELHFSKSGKVSGAISSTKATLNSEEIGVVWFRRWADFLLPQSFSESEMAFARTECRSFLSGFFNSLTCPWINDIHREQIASNKPWQIKVAKQIGLTIPETLITNQPDRVKAFFGQCDGKIIFKPPSGISSSAIDYGK